MDGIAQHSRLFLVGASIVSMVTVAIGYALRAFLLRGIGARLARYE